MADIDQVIRRWLAGERIRAIARSTGSDRNTVRRIVRFAAEAGIRADTPWPDESKLQAIRQRMGRPGTTVAVGEAEEQLKPRTEQLCAWLGTDHLLLTKVHELLGREGLVVSYSALYRFARKWCDFGPASSITVRRAETLAGEMAEVDFGRLGLLQELGSCRPRVVHGFILTLGYSRLSCVIPVFRQTDRLLKNLGRSRADNSFDRELRSFITPELLVMDDFALKKLSSQATSDFYDLLIERHTRSSTIITSNRGIDEWLAVFDEPMLGQSALDRFCHRAHQFVIEGESYRKRLAPGSVPKTGHQATSLKL